MKHWFKEVLADIRARRHLEGYVAFLILILLGVVGILGDELAARILTPALLFGLSYIIAKLISTDRTRELETELAEMTGKYREAADRNQGLLSSIYELSKDRQVSYEFIPMDLEDQRSYLRIRQKTTELISQARFEVLILDSNKDDLPNHIRYGQGLVDQEERNHYYHELIARANAPLKDKFRYVRVLHVPASQNLVDVLRCDQTLATHCSQMVELSQTRPQRVALHTAEHLPPGAFILVDGSYLMFDLMFSPPNRAQVKGSMGGTFFLTDREGRVASHFQEIINWIILNSPRVNSIDDWSDCAENTPSGSLLEANGQGVDG